MKTRFYLITSLALTGALLGCQREPMVNNPNYDPDTETVKTKFVFNLSTAANDTKQLASETQATATAPFLGIDDAWIFAYKQATGTNPVTYPGGKILAEDASTTSFYNLSNLLGAGDLAQQTEATQTDKPSHRVLEMQLPIYTNTLLFYGRAKPGTVDSSDPWSVYDHFGHMDAYTVNGDQGSADFRLGKRLADQIGDAPGAQLGRFQNVEKLLAGIFTVIMNSNLKGTARKTVTAATKPTTYEVNDEEKAALMKPYGYALSASQATTTAADYYPAITWADYARSDGKSPVSTESNRFPLENKLYTVYKEMTTIHTSEGELRAGSGEAILYIVKDLWSVVNSVRCAQPTGKEEAVAKMFAQVVTENLLQYFNAIPPSDGSALTAVSYKQFTTITANMTTDMANTDRWINNETANGYKPDMTVLGTLPEDYDLKKFPYIFNLPRGGTHMAFRAKVSDTDATAVNCFYYPQTFNTSGMSVSSGTTYNAQNYYYPAEILYFGNSPIRVRDDELTEADYPNGAMRWNDSSQWTQWSSGSEGYVRSSTSAVAMQYNINYGVALLETKVQIGSATLKDNNAFIQNRDNQITEEDRTVVINGTDKYFKLTGIIIGGQSQNVGWDYLPIDPPGWTEGQTKDGFIFDPVMPTENNGNKVPAHNGGTTASAYTVVFDNFFDNRPVAQRYDAFNLTTEQATELQNAQKVVAVALELQNNAGDFYGNHNLIKHGDYFYLIGLIDPNSAGVGMTWPTNYVLPPYKSDGTSLQIKRVFMQDCVTSVTFTIGENSLKSAYLTVPDLKSTSLTLGLSVDLAWTPGLEFNNVILGN